MEWDRLRIFYHIAKAGSITRAAEQLNISQPALSRSLQLLEHRLKAQLFDRTARGIKLTKQGEILLKHTCNMMNEFSVATKTMNNSNTEEEPSGPLKILTNHSTAYSWLIHYIGDFMKLFPKVRIAITCDNNRRYDNDTDAYIGPYLSHRPDLVQIYIKTFITKLFAGKKYLEEFGVPQSPEDLDNHRLITFDADSFPKGHYSTNWILQLGRKSGHVREPYLQVNSAHALLNAARDNLGIVSTGKDYPKLEKINDLVEVLPDFEGPQADIYYTYPVQMKSVRTVVEFGEYLKQTFADETVMPSKHLLENLENVVYLSKR
jgi:DNA-binding transcriptional LysR family regulator